MSSLKTRCLTRCLLGWTLHEAATGLRCSSFILLPWSRAPADLHLFQCDETIQTAAVYQTVDENINPSGGGGGSGGCAHISKRSYTVELKVPLKF